MSARVVAALYVDPRGPYPALDGVDCWDETRDARHFPGPYPIVAHPPCGPWGRLRHLCRYQDPALAPLAIEQLIAWGGVLEHPHDSRLWSLFRLPLPGGLPQWRGGRLLWTITVEQSRWGHKCAKRTTLLLADVPPAAFPPLPPPREPTHVVSTYSKRSKEKAQRDGKRRASAPIRRRTPLAFAALLVALARSVPDGEGLGTQPAPLRHGRKVRQPDPGGGSTKAG
jgi:hypothetical protein